jgi:choline dehydrogenase-like flavoprotein
VLANRLSVNPSVKVLLVERGSLNDTLVASNVLLSHPPFGLLPVRGIKMVPQEALSNRSDTTYESLSLGGRTRINAGLYLPGCPAEYECWGEGWQWDDVAPFFWKSEGRLELERVKTVAPSQAKPKEGGEWKTRIVKAEFESSRQCVFFVIPLMAGLRRP